MIFAILKKICENEIQIISLIDICNHKYYYIIN